MILNGGKYKSILNYLMENTKLRELAEILINFERSVEVRKDGLRVIARGLVPGVLAHIVIQTDCDVGIKVTPTSIEASLVAPAIATQEEISKCLERHIDDIRKAIDKIYEELLRAVFEEF